MTTVVNLNQYRKKRQKDERAKQAKENRIKSGLTAPERKRDRLEKHRQDAEAENHRITPREPSVKGEPKE